MELQRDEVWIAKIQMYPGDRLMNRVISIYFVEKTGDVGFLMIGDETVYWRSQVEWFEPVERVNV